MFLLSFASGNARIYVGEMEISEQIKMRYGQNGSPSSTEDLGDEIRTYILSEEQSSNRIIKQRKKYDNIKSGY